MPVAIHIPTPLRPFTDKLDTVQASGATVGEVLQDLTTKHAGLKQHLYTPDGKLRSFVNIYVGDEDIRYLQKEQTPVTDGQTLSIIPSVAGGVGAAAPAAALPALDGEEIKRYSRHLILSEVGMEGQQKLKAAKVLCIGAGGLGSPVAMYLAAAGVGTIGIVDFDTVDLSNLQRQILHGTADIGRSKLASAQDMLQRLNPHVKVVPHEVALSSQNALDIFRGYDVIVDGTDNFPTRYLVNDACVLLGIPNAYGSIFRFEGQASVFATKDGPCYRCLYPEPPPPGLVPSCAEAGVLGILPGLVGTIQATETVKLILGIGQTLAGRFLIYDAMRMRFRELTLRKDPACPLCGTNRTVTKLIDYEEFCGLSAAGTAAEDAADLEISALELAERQQRGDDLVLIDVREPQEYEIARIPGSILIPLNSLPERMSELDSSREIVLQCHVGQRSMRALEMLHRAGFRKLKNLRGGIAAWSRDVDSSVPRY